MEVDNKVLDILLQFCCLDFLHEEPRRGCLAKRGHINLPHEYKSQMKTVLTHVLSVMYHHYKFSFFPMLVPLWNALPSNVVLAVDLEGFKDALTKVHTKSIYPN